MPGSALPWDLEASASPCFPTSPTTTQHSSLFPRQVSALPHRLCQGKAERGQAGISGGAALPKHSSQGAPWGCLGSWHRHGQHRSTLTFWLEGSFIGRLLLTTAVALRLHVLREARIQAQQGTPGCQDLAPNSAGIPQLRVQLRHSWREWGLLQEAGSPVPIPQLRGRGGRCTAALGQGLQLVWQQRLQPLLRRHPAQLERRLEHAD